MKKWIVKVFYFSPGNEAKMKKKKKKIHILKLNSQKQSPTRVFIKSVLLICNTFAGKHSRKSVISIKLHGNLIEITLLHHENPPVHLLCICRKPFFLYLFQNLISFCHEDKKREYIFKQTCIIFCYNQAFKS